MDRLLAEAEPLIIDRPGWDRKYRAAMKAIDAAREVGLEPTPYFVEALAYWHRAKALQDQNILGQRRKPVGDPLQETIPIYDTVQRRYAGFSNVLEQLWYGDDAPKYRQNVRKGLAYPRPNLKPDGWLYVFLVHRCTGSGASFEADHGWRNTIVPQMAVLKTVEAMANFVKAHPAPVGTSIGNQYPAVRKQEDLRGARNHLQYYLAYDAPELISKFFKELRSRKLPIGIKEAVDIALDINTTLGQKRFVFVLTAWVMDIAEYYPNMVDPASDCYHGANARESWERLFKGTGEKLYDKAARFMATETKTWPMDIEDVMCDAVRWIESYVPKNGFQHVIDQGIFSSCSLRHDQGRQRNEA